MTEGRSSLWIIARKRNWMQRVAGICVWDAQFGLGVKRLHVNWSSILDIILHE